MIRISSSLIKRVFVNSKLLVKTNKMTFAKQAKPAKDDKKGGKTENKQQVPVVEQPTEKLKPHERIINYFSPLQPNLSPSEQQTLNERFTDLQDEQKEMLDQLASKIAGLNTALFYDVAFRREALGAGEGFVVGSGKWEDDQVNEAIKVLRKQV